jgi:hypothetical protein
MMTTTQIVVISIVTIVIVAGIAMLLFMRNRSKKLQARFGPEYNRAVQETGSRFKAETKLEKLEQRVERYSIRDLSPVDRSRFQQSWRTIQATFVDDPERALAEADRLLGQVMSARGYPMADFTQRAAEISVDHATVVEHYRAGHNIALRHSQGKATTEELRQGMIHYRALFDELVGESERSRTRAAGLG